MTALVLLLAGTSRGGTWTLPQAYDRAVLLSETMKISQAELEQASARFRQLRGQTLPQISLRLSEQIQDPTQDNGEGGVAGTFLDSSRPEARIRVSQALFSGFQDLALLAAAKAERRASERDWDQARRTLAGDLAEAFYSALDRRRNLESLEELLVLTQGRLKELKGRVALGRSRKSEVTAVELQIRNIEADRARARNDSARAGEMLGFLIGEEAPSLAEDAGDPMEPGDRSAWLALIDQRPDLVSRAEKSRAADRRLAAARRARWPLIRAEGNYFLYRTGIQDGVDWDALVILDWPLFSGGSQVARMSEAKALVQEEEALLSQARRRAAMECASAWEDLKASQETLRHYTEALAFAEENYEFQSADYRLGLASNLEVSAAMTQLYEAKRNRERSRLQALLDAFWLKVVSGAPLFDKEIP